eukprot:m.259661 g.259661  ORF g.259661 m.259661 type:complete len:110 (-) comp16205_c0_seq23:425-754(-)
MVVKGNCFAPSFFCFRIQRKFLCSYRVGLDEIGRGLFTNETTAIGFLMDSDTFHPNKDTLVRLSPSEEMSLPPSSYVNPTLAVVAPVIANSQWVRVCHHHFSACFLNSM